MLKILFLFVISIQVAFGQKVLNNAPDLKKIDVEEHLGTSIPLDLHFMNDNGDSVTIGDYFNQGKPVLLSLAYYECPMLCTFVLNGLTKTASKMDFTPGNEYQMVTVSIDPEETVKLASAKKHTHTNALNKKNAANGWSFLVGDKNSSQSLADALGFKYYYDEERDEYAHPAVVFVLTDEAVISRYLYGVDYDDNDLRLALVEASEGKIGNTIDKFLLYCFYYNPDEKGYVLFAGNVMKLGGVITILFLGMTLAVLWRKDSNKKLSVKKNK